MRFKILFLGLARICVAVSALTTCALAQEQKKVEGPRILVGPNILVSRSDADLPHAETMVAVNPFDKKNLLGASIVFTRDERGTTTKTYASRDGGHTWSDTSFPERFAFSGVDPQVAFGLHGTAYFLSVNAGATYLIHFYRSEDGGFSWERPRTLRGADHPQMVVDQNSGRFAGRVYITAMHGVRKLAVSRSETDGKDFLGPVEVPNPRGFFLLNMNPLVFSDGTLFIPYLAWDDTGGRKPTATVSEFVTSTDGGISFSPPTRVLEQSFKSYSQPTELRGSFVSGTNVVYAIDPRADRLYVAASDEDRGTGSRRLIFAYSADRGRTWSAPRQVSPDTTAGSQQYQPMIAVNKDGTVGVAWFDTREAAADRNSYHLYFTASVDGGNSFLPARKVSSQPSLPINSINLTPFTGFSQTKQGNLEQRFRSAFGRWANGGDYMGFTADAEGAFHPFWIDSRSGTFQVWTSRIRIANQNEGTTDRTSVAKNLSKVSIGSKVALITDPPRYDAEKQEAVIPIRLKNVSTETLYPPISVMVKKVDQWAILNAGSGKNGAGAVFDYSSALGDLFELRPGEMTEAVLWRFKYSGLGPSPSLEVEITGFVLERPTPVR